MISTSRVLETIRSFARTAHSFATLRTARFARALRRAHSFARTAYSLASELMGKRVFVYEMNASISYSFNPLSTA